MQKLQEDLLEDLKEISRKLSKTILEQQELLEKVSAVADPGELLEDRIVIKQIKETVENLEKKERELDGLIESLSSIFHWMFNSQI